MIKADVTFLDNQEAYFDTRKAEILNSKDSLNIQGTTYYVSNDGNDNNDGLSEASPWKSLKKVSETEFHQGDGVRFKRGDLFRGKVKAQNGVTYGAYGEGEKPKFYSWEKSLGDPRLWELFDCEHSIWKLKEKILDVGTLVFNEGEEHSRKLIPSYRDGQFLCRDNEEKLFDMKEEMTKDLDLFWYFDGNLSTKPSKGEDFPIPVPDEGLGELYLRCDKGNPAEVFKNIEALARVHMISAHDSKNVTIDNLCIKYVGMHGIAAGGQVENLTVTNCEMGWIGGCIQHYSGTDPNYPRGRRGSVTRFGNAIEIYGGCNGYTVQNNYIYEVYDAAITHQITTRKKILQRNIEYTGNLIEKCVYGIEYFLDQIEGERESIMENVMMKNNFIRLSGYGWGQQRHNIHTPALIKGWSYVNTAKNFIIEDNIFDRCAYRMLHLVALKDEYCAQMNGNTYIQHLGGRLGQYGGNEEQEPENLIFDENAEKKIQNVFGDRSAKVYYIE